MLPSVAARSGRLARVLRTRCCSRRCQGSSRVDVVEHRLERRRRRRSRRPRCTRLQLGVDLGARALARARRVHAPSAARGSSRRRSDRIALAPGLDLVVGAVGLRIVAGRVAAHAIGDQPRSASAPRRAPRARPPRASTLYDGEARRCRRRARPGCRRPTPLLGEASRSPSAARVGTLIAQPLLRQQEHASGVLNTPAKFRPVWKSVRAGRAVAEVDTRRRRPRCLILAAQAKPTACVICVPIGELTEPKRRSRAV